MAQKDGKYIAEYLQREIEINKCQIIEGCTDKEIEEFFGMLIMSGAEQGWKASDNVTFLMTQAYTYGVIQGKRIERSRKVRDKR